ncbi:putative Max-like protein X [Hypsibius exemplaris]|uniref:Max-like protein X n=1 Tax=Hypsibius exemplaris TaxID=2072580 RepID=A0A1W0X7E2_HYPEX|nr:putative Max-like protein X [Hypsibius exemplaris]
MYPARYLQNAATPSGSGYSINGVPNHNQVHNAPSWAAVEDESPYITHSKRSAPAYSHPVQSHTTMSATPNNWDSFPDGRGHSQSLLSNSATFPTSFSNREETPMYSHPHAGGSLYPSSFALPSQSSYSATASSASSLATSPISNISPGSSPPHFSEEDTRPMSAAAWRRHRSGGGGSNNRRREAHTLAEQKRRDEIKKGYQALQDVLPLTQSNETTGSQRVSKATVLQSSIDYVGYLTEAKRREQEELESLKNDLMALQIMKQSYDKISIQSSEQQTPAPTAALSDTQKFQLFQSISDELFRSFDACVNPSSFAELSGTAFGWLEEYCKPTELHLTVAGILKNIHQQQPAANAPYQMNK